MFEKRDWAAQLPSVAELDDYLESLEAELERVRRLRDTVRHLRDGAAADGPAAQPDRQT